MKVAWKYEIEKKPESIIRCEVEPAVGLREFQAREIAFELGIDASLVQQLQKTLIGCYSAFRTLDATMLEINPLAITRDSYIIALDAKMTFDENALFRHPRIAELGINLKRILVREMLPIEG